MPFAYTVHFDPQWRVLAITTTPHPPSVPDAMLSRSVSMPSRLQDLLTPRVSLATGTKG